MSRICLTLPGPDCRSNLQFLHQYAGTYSAFEVRLDYLLSDLHRVPDFLGQVFQDGELAKALELQDDGDFSVILTLRRPEDGGIFGAEEETAQTIFLEILLALEGMPDWENIRRVLAIDIESQSDMPALSQRIADLGLTKIASSHVFHECPLDLGSRLASLGAGGAVPKLAVMPADSSDLARIFQIGRNYAEAHPGRRFILLGMGKYGVPSRILPEKLGSCMSYAAVGNGVAPGQVDCRELFEKYRSRPISADTKIFAIVGNPVDHSRSPEYHNAEFSRKNVDARYIPLLMDDVLWLPVLAEQLDLVGCSVTIPHKENVRRLLKTEDDASRLTGACNTIIRRSTSWEGYNSDVPGFLAPIENELSSNGGDITHAVVIGAGGAARAICYGLLSRGVKVLVLNRTRQRRQELVEGYSRHFPGKIRSADLDSTALDLIRDYRALIVQTTSVGMEGKDSEDPLHFYDFSGDETVYDIIYTPPVTPLIRRAAASGCKTINGWEMFVTQARIQSEHFLSLL